MGKKIFILLVVALIGMLLLPALASATLVNEYGMHFAGQEACTSCQQHFGASSPLNVGPALHGRFATAGITRRRIPRSGPPSAAPATSRRWRAPARRDCDAGG